MRKFRRIVVMLLCIVLLAGCAMTPTAAPSATPSPTSTPLPTATPPPTPTSGPIPVLPSGLLDTIGIGTDLYAMLGLAQISYDGTTYAPPTVYDLSGGGRVTFTLDASGYRVIGIQVEGQPDVVPAPDPTPVTDYRISVGTLNLEPGSPVRLSSTLAVLGSPVIDETCDRSRLKAHVVGRRLVFPGMELTLYQTLDAKDKDVWNLDAVGLLSAVHATPRGLRVGVPTGDAVRLFGTGGFLMGQFSGTPTVLDTMTVYQGATYAALTDPRVIVVHFFEGKVGRIDIENSESIRWS